MENKIKSKKLFLFLPAIIILLILFDQTTKYIIQKLYPDLLSANIGVAFGALKNASTNGAVILLSIIIVLSGLYFLFVVKPKREQWMSFVLMISGISSNLIDRLVIGHVRDFIDIRIWPSFNFADSMIVVGAILLITSEIFPISKRP